MNKKLLHTPEGVRDIYNEECEKKLFLQDTIHRTIKSYGFNDIQTPTFEFFDIYNKEKGSVESQHMYKFFDREGYTLVLRPDITPAIARAVSKYYMDYDMPLRYCYMGNTYRNNAEHQGKLKEFTQIGGELIGDNKSDADAEAVAITIESLLKCGLTEFQIEIGHTDFFNGLAMEADLDEDSQAEFKKHLDNKNYFGAEELIYSHCSKENLRELFSRLPEFSGSIHVIKQAGELVNNELIANALDRMEKVYNILSYYGYEKYISFDLSLTSNYNYYTGLIFRGYTYGTGDAVATGGRYDRLFAQYGKDAPAIGFVINLDQLLIALNRQKINLSAAGEKILMLYENDYKEAAIKAAMSFRSSGKNTSLLRKSSTKSLDDYKQYAIENKFSEMHYVDGTDSILKLI